MEQTLHNTMLAAQRSAEDIVSKANAEADSMLRDAELKAKEIIHNALAEKQKVAGELVRIKQAEEEFRTRFKALLERQLRQVNEVTLPEDVNVLLGETDEGTVGDVTVTASPSPGPGFAFGRPAPVAATAAEPVPAAVPTVDAPAEPAGAGEPALWTPESESQPEGDDSGAAPARPSSAVESVQLGEVESPEIDPEVELVEPSEFRMPTLDTLGEREEDTRHRGDRLGPVVRLAVHVTPKASHPGATGWRGGELQVRVSVAPEGGKANAAVCRTIAAALGIPKSQVGVVRGRTSRRKVIELHDVTEEQVRETFGSPDVTERGAGT